LRRMLLILTVAATVATVWVVAGTPATGSELSWIRGDESHAATYVDHPPWWGRDYAHLAAIYYGHLHLTFW
jgi:hypothetical protein